MIAYDGDAGWSSPVARRAHNPKVGGSNPPPATKFTERTRLGDTERVLLSFFNLTLQYTQCYCAGASRVD